MNITLSHDKQPDVTVLPNEFITNYMVTADGEFVKIYLLLMHLIQSNTFTGIEQIADILELTQKDVIRAVRYWSEQGLLQVDQELAAPVTEKRKTVEPPGGRVIQMTGVPRPMQETIKEPERAATTVSVPKKEGFSANDQEKTKLSHSIYMAETYLGKPLTPTELNSFCYIDTALNFSPDLMEYLIEYCVSREKKSVRYMETVAINWYQNGIDTVEKAKTQSASYNQNVFGIMKAFGISGRNPGNVEMEYIRRWNKMGFPNEIIEEACSRTVISAHKPSFPYANSILESWKKEGVRTLDDIKALDAKHQQGTASGSNSTPQKKKNKFHNFEQRSYDYDTLESKLLKQ